MKNLRNILSRITTPLAQKQGFIRASILLDWDIIVGEKFAAFCQPEKIIFPHERRTGGRLTLKTSSAFALEISHLEPLIVEKINQYFGYKAVDKLLIKNGKITPKPKKKHPIPTVDQATLEHLESITDDIQDPKLRQTLIELGKGVLSQANHPRN
ncbi:MAG: DUF721 domain-containing protein [Candidatus Paracaedibacteraceae bacterium]|nr:DUF721 domain-containing protein [Candidatus Paracaedibacteraceae bacterium]